MRVVRVVLAVLLGVVLPGAFAVAQDATAPAPPASGTITGIITDPQSVPLPGAAVEVRSESRGVTRVAMTDGEGKYEIKGLPPATDYILKVSFSGGGFSSVTQDRIVVRADKTTTESVQLYQERIEEVIVSAKSEGPRVVALDDIGSSTTFSSEFVEALPLLGRNFQDVLTLAPGVVDPDNDGNPNVLGGRAENFQVLVDGVSNQDPLTGTFLSNINTDAIEDFEIIQTGADASFSRGSAGFANIVTKSGTNEFEGTFTLSYRSSLLDGNGMTGEPEVGFSQIRPALNISGPILKDRLWYFFSDEEFQDEIPVNTLSGRGTLIREVLGRRYLAKVTWALNPNNKITASVRSDPLDFTHLGVNTLVAPEAGFTQTQGGPFYQIDLDTVFSPTLLLASKLSFADTQIGQIPTTPQSPGDTRPFLAPGWNINGDTGEITGSRFLQFDRTVQRLTWREDVTLFVEDFFGRHDITFGSRFEREHIEEDGHRGIVRNFQLINNLFGTDSPQIEGAGRRLFVTETFGIPDETGGAFHREGDSDILGVYISDTWRPHENVVLSLGLRVDVENVTGPAYQPFDVRGEFSDFQRFISECNALAGSIPGGATAATHTLLAERFPEDFSAYMAQNDIPDDGITPFDDCLDGRAWFYTFPKETFTEDCFNGTDGVPCTPTLTNANPVRQFLGDLAPDSFDITNRNLAPRLQVSWDPWGDQKTKLFGSWNRFYDKVNLTAAIIEQGPDLRSRDFDFTTGTNLVTSDQAGGGDPTVTVVDRNLRTEFNDEWTIGFEREIAPETRLRLQYTSRKFRDQLQDVDYNHYARDIGPEYLQPVTREVNGRNVVVGYTPFGGQGPCWQSDLVQGLEPAPNFTPPQNVVVLGQRGQPNGEADDCFGDFATGGNGQRQPVADGVPDLFRRNPYFNNVLFLSNLNYSEFEGVTIEFTRRLSRNWQLQASWVHGRSVGAAENFQDESGDDPSLVDDEFGYTAFDIRDVVTVSATTILPWELNLGTIMRYFSGTPYSIRELELSRDNLSQSTLRTTFPTGGRNDQRDEPVLLVDVSIQKPFLIKKYNAQAELLIGNLFADDFLTIGDFVNGRRIAVRDFGRQFELRFRLNF